MLIKILQWVFVFGLLIIAHELGHYLLARWNGIKVLEFSFGFGPKLFKYQGKETVYSVRLFPIGGFVKLYGMDQEIDEQGKPILVSINNPRSFMNKKVWQRASVIAAGPIMNFILAIVLFVFVYAVMGIPTAGTGNSIGSLIEGKPAAQAGIQPGDKIVAVDGVSTPDWESLTEIIHARPNQSLQIVIDRSGARQEASITTEVDEATGNGMIGIYPEVIYQPASLLKAASYGWERTVDFTKLIVVTLAEMVTGKTKAEVGGPVMIAQAINQAAAEGWASLLSFAGMLSLQLGLLNLFPIPALDGSKLVFLGIEGVRGRPIKPERENIINLIGFVLLMTLMVAVTYQDIMRLFD